MRYIYAQIVLLHVTEGETSASHGTVPGVTSARRKRLYEERQWVAGHSPNSQQTVIGPGIGAESRRLAVLQRLTGINCRTEMIQRGLCLVVRHARVQGAEILLACITTIVLSIAERSPNGGLVLELAAMESGGVNV